MYGISPNSGVGGVINIVPKRPLDEDLTRVTTTTLRIPRWVVIWI
jgi:iron complex outermembrane receptor protein